MTRTRVPGLDVGSWEPRAVVDEILVDPMAVAALQALLDDGQPPVGPGDALPPLWHWVALASWAPSSVLGNDGHALRGSFLPPVALPRRMFAGGEVILHQPLTIGAIVRRESEVVSVEHKMGRSGELVIVQVAIRLGGADGALFLEERQSIIYRGAGVPTERRDACPPLTDAADSVVGVPLRRLSQWRWSLTTDPTLLMRFSAATANTHRIHYDWPYATQVEGYPGLVVQGPLTALALAQTVRLERPHAVVRRLRHRNVAPLFCGDSATLTLSEHSETVAGEEVTVSLEADSTVRATVSVSLSARSSSTGNLRNPNSAIPVKGHQHA